MTQAVARIIEQARNLSREDYADLVDELVLHQRADIPPEVERRQLEIVRRRIAEIGEGTARLAAAEEVIQRGRDRLDAIREAQRDRAGISSRG
jgi:hypothetical protein